MTAQKKCGENDIEINSFLGELVICLSPGGKFVFMSWEVEIMASGEFRSLDWSKMQCTISTKKKEM